MQDKRKTEDDKRKQQDSTGQPDVSGVAGRESLIIEGTRPASKDDLREVSPGAAEDADAAQKKR